MSKARLLAVMVIAIVATVSAYALGTRLRPESQTARIEPAGNLVIAASALAVGAGRMSLLGAAETASGVQP